MCLYTYKFENSHYGCSQPLPRLVALHFLLTVPYSCYIMCVLKQETDDFIGNLWSKEHCNNNFVLLYLLSIMNIAYI